MTAMRSAGSLRRQMRLKRSTAFLGAAICASAGFVVQAVGLARYVGRLPDDWVAVGLYSATLVAEAYHYRIDAATSLLAAAGWRFGHNEVSAERHKCDSQNLFRH